MSKKIKQNMSEDVVVEALKKQYFELAAIERIGETPQITEKVDNLEEAIKSLLNGKGLK